MSFFDKIGEKASEVYNSTAEKTSKITKEMKLKSAISDNKNKINKIYQDMGEKLFQKYKDKNLNETEKEFKEEFYQIELYKKEIEDAQTEIYSLKDSKLCEKCAKVINATAKFCPFCGTVQKENISEEVVAGTEPKEESQEKICDVKEELEKNEIKEIVMASEESKREPIIELEKSKDILDIPEPDIIIEEIGENNSEENQD